MQALNIASAVIQETKSRGLQTQILDIGGGFPAPCNRHVRPFSAVASKINAEIDRPFPSDGGAEPCQNGVRQCNPSNLA